jgi:hypothetical protein
VIGLSMNTQEGIILQTDTRTGRAVNIVSEWLLFNVKWAICQAISWREQVTFWDDADDEDVLEQHAQLDFHSARSLTQQSAWRHVAPLWHILV